MEGNFDDKVIGAIYEKILTENPSKRKSTGSYYTPEEIAAYICKHTVEKCLLDRINDRFSENYSSLDSIVNSHSVTHLSSLVDELKEIKILDPAVGSGYFLDSIIRELLSIYHKIRSVNEELDLSLGLHTTIPFNNDSSKRMNLLEIDDEEEFELLLKYSIIFPRNIYGVDINPNAVEIVKIRLFLSLVKHSYTKNFDIVHLSSFRFNLRTGNALISSTRLKRESKVDYEYLKIINWHSEFPEVFENRRGFDIIIGNPPYVNPSDVDYWHLLEDSKNLYDAFIRLSVTLLTEGGRLGFIHPNSAYCQPKFRELREFLKVNTDDLTIINFAIRPQPVFKGIMQRTAITTCKRETNGCKTVKTSRYLRLTGTNRNELLKNPPVFDSSDIAWKFANFIPKIGNDLDHSIFCKVFSQEKAISDIIDKKTGRILYYHDSGESYWTKLILDEPVGIRNGKKVRASHWRKIQVLPEYLYFLACYINSSLFYWIWLTISDCRDLTLETLMQTPVPSIQAITGEYSDNLKFYTKQLMQCYRDNSKYVEKRPGYASLEFRVNRCKELINEIDQVIGRIFKLNDCEIKYLVDYDREMRTG
ncbi:MAG: Eco57I restriction-modification methylase domain-containing protein [Candidatus Odinarchaeota archaeon]